MQTNTSGTDIPPNLIIGDGDSISEENRKRYGHLLHRIAEQETNDQTKAVNYLLSQGKRRIAIVGATGKREDHTLGNISLLMDYMRAGADVRTYTDHGIFIPCRNTCTFTCQPGQQVSIINFNARKLHGLGLVYPLSDFTNWWQGTLDIGRLFLFATHKGLQLLRYLYRLTDNILYRIFELGRMSRFQEDARLPACNPSCNARKPHAP